MRLIVTNGGSLAGVPLRAQYDRQAARLKGGLNTSQGWQQRPLQQRPDSSGSLDPRSGWALKAAGQERASVWSFDESDAINTYARRKFQTRSSPTGNAVVVFVDKLKRAWQIFFPPDLAALNPREEGKNRLRMILVADRCGLSPTSLMDMKESIVEAVSEFVEIDAEGEIDISMTTDEETGLVYSVAVPVKRVRSRMPTLAAEVSQPSAADDDAVWDEDPAARFPYGT